MHEGQTQAAVRLAEVVPGPHAWGLGALEGLHGEATVLDDAVWLARPKADGTAEVRRAELDGADAAQGAALFVVANVESWSETVVQNEVPWDQLDPFIEAAIRAHGVGRDAPVAVRVEGPLAMLKWHVVDGSKLLPGAGHAEHARTAVSGVVERSDARLIGFFSTSHQGVFTHAGSWSHFHALVESSRVSGHVDGVTLEPGARLLIATR
jgi:alpha-acetolactate decarboxylase